MRELQIGGTSLSAATTRKAENRKGRLALKKTVVLALALLAFAIAVGANSDIDPYAELEVSRTASLEEVRKRRVHNWQCPPFFF